MPAPSTLRPVPCPVVPIGNEPWPQLDFEVSEWFNLQISAVQAIETHAEWKAKTRGKDAWLQSRIGQITRADVVLRP